MSRTWDKLGLAGSASVKKPRRNAQRRTMTERQTANILSSGNENKEAAPWMFGEF